MKIPYKLLSYTSLLFFSLAVMAQEKVIDPPISAPKVEDSVVLRGKTDRYGLRMGIDLSKIVRSVLDDEYTGLEVGGDFRIKKDYYLAVELGNETRNAVENTFDATIKGSYLKAGFNYNAYNNWYGMSNLIYVGVRAGFSTYNSELTNYTIYTTNTFFDPDVKTDPLKFDGLSASWLEVQLGVQTELFNNLYLGINVQLKRLITATELEGFGNLFVPGFNKITTDSNFGLGYGYTLSYLIPIFKK